MCTCVCVLSHMCCFFRVPRNFVITTELDKVKGIPNAVCSCCTRGRCCVIGALCTDRGQGHERQSDTMAWRDSGRQTGYPKAVLDANVSSGHVDQNAGHKER